MPRWWTGRSSVSIAQGVTVTVPVIDEWIPQT